MSSIKSSSPVDQEDICNICLEPLGQTNRTTTPCGHEFCFKCIIKAYQHNPVCPCCRAQFNETAETAENAETPNTNAEEYNEISWRRGRFDTEYYDCYCYPAIVETVKDFDLVLRTISGSYDAEDRIRTMIKLVDPECTFGEGEDNDWADESAENESETVKAVLDIYKRTQHIKHFAEKHIEIQRSR